MRQLAVAYHNWTHDTWDGGVPPATMPCADVAAGRRLSWLVGLLPHVEQVEVARRIDVKCPWDDRANVAAGSAVIKTYLCPCQTGK